MVERLTVNQNVVGSNPTIFSFASCICSCSLIVEHNSHKIKGAGSNPAIGTIKNPK